MESLRLNEIASILHDSTPAPHRRVSKVAIAAHLDLVPQQDQPRLITDKLAQIREQELAEKARTDQFIANSDPGKVLHVPEEVRYLRFSRDEIEAFAMAIPSNLKAI